MKNLFNCFLMGLIIFMCSCGSQDNEESRQFKVFVEKHVQVIKPLMKESGTSYFSATISGKEEDFNRFASMNLALSKIYTNKEEFEQLKAWKESKKITDPLLARQLEVLFTSYQEKQLDTTLLAKIIKMESEVETKYSNFRAKVNGKAISDNDVEEILSSSTKTEEVKAAWLGCKEIGPLVASDVLQLVKMRNEAAKSLGFANYHQMSLQFGEQDPEAISKLFDELDNLTRDTYLKLKSQVDEHLAKKFGLKKEELQPWHYQNRFFQEAPKIYSVDFDQYFKDKDVVALTRDFFSGIGLPVDSIMAASDLYEKPGKNQHAYCIDIDNEGDVRVLCNVKPNHSWMGTMLHEFGHAVYDKYMTDEIPFILREPAHTFTTEAIAMLFGRLASNPVWIKDMAGISDQERERIQGDAFNSLRLEQLVFSRWSQVMYRFEKAMYENPDQDLNTLWWDLVEKYQGMKRPAGRNMPDWATKIHIATSPCYYHNYLMGELLASQLNHYIGANLLKSSDLKNQSYVKRTEIGSFLRDRVFEAGSLYLWDDMIEKATGEKLSPRYYAEQFLN